MRRAGTSATTSGESIGTSRAAWPGRWPLVNESKRDRIEGGWETETRVERGARSSWPRLVDSRDPRSSAALIRFLRSLQSLQPGSSWLRSSRRFAGSTLWRSVATTSAIAAIPATRIIVASFVLAIRAIHVPALCCYDFCDRCNPFDPDNRGFVRHVFRCVCGRSTAILAGLGSFAPFSTRQASPCAVRSARHSQHARHEPLILVRLVGSSNQRMCRRVYASNSDARIDGRNRVLVTRRDLPHVHPINCHLELGRSGYLATEFPKI